MVSDFSSVGFPQLGIWTNDAKQSLTPNKIVEFNEGQNMGSQDSSISNILHEKYQVGMLWTYVLNFISIVILLYVDFW